MSKSSALSPWRLALVGLAVLGSSTVAFGLPWDIDMADSQSSKAYEYPMAPLPEGVVSQENVLTPRSFTPNYTRGTPESETLTNPSPADDATLATGERMYGVYCYPCHGMGAQLGPVGQPGRFPGVVPLTGEGGIAPSRSDAWIYLTIRNGGMIMPSYGWSMNDTEMWSIVSYIRTLPNGARTPPPAPTPVEVTP